MKYYHHRYGHQYALRWIPYGHQWIDRKDIDEVIKILRSDWLTQGPQVLKFEQALAKYCGAKYAVAVSHGTDALHLAYLTAGLKKGDEVITTPNTFVATTNMLLAIGAKPVFCDIRLDTYNIDEEKIEKFITKKTKAIVPLHFAGHPCEMDKILKIAKKHKLLVIEDACHALGAKKVCNSDMAILSFHPVKSITTGEGGAIITNSKKYYDKLVLLRNHGIYKNKEGENIMIELGYNNRMTDFQAALGINQLNKIDSFIKRRRRVVDWYQAELKNENNIVLPTELPGRYSSWHIYVIRVKDSKLRDSLVDYLSKNNIGVSLHYPCVYQHPYYQKNGFRAVKCPNAEIYTRTTITLPLHPLLTKKQIHFISNTIKSFFKSV